jgi:Uma2 family endonuclease
MDIQLDKRLITRNEYHKMVEVGILAEDDKIELINGEIINMSPIGSKHAAIVRLLDTYLTKRLSQEFIVSAQCPLVLNNTSEPEPDLVVLKKREDNYMLNHPTAADAILIIEVASSSLLYDKEIKSSLYAQSGIPEYWIVDIEKDQIIQMSKPENNYTETEIINAHQTVEAKTIDSSLCLEELMRS